jgi:cytochrome c biogenesis protein CcdA
MLLLILIALLAGAGTALSPCALPVLPALLSASGTGGRRRPLGVVVGLGVTFAVTIIVIDKVVGNVAIGQNAPRYIAIVVLIASGAVLLIPKLAEKVEAPLARFSRLGPRTKGTGFGSGLLVGGALGFVYTPCAGPILASITTVGAVSGRTIPVGIAYAGGSSLALLLLALFGRAGFDRIRRAGGGAKLQRVLGVILILTGVVFITNVYVSIDNDIAKNISNINLTAGLEKSSAVTNRLHDITGRKQKFVITPADQKKIDAVAKYEEGSAASSTSPSGAPAASNAIKGP